MATLTLAEGSCSLLPVKIAFEPTVMRVVMFTFFVAIARCSLALSATDPVFLAQRRDFGAGSRITLKTVTQVIRCFPPAGEASDHP